MPNNKTLGIYDSGLGGYSVYQDLRVAYPKYNMVLYADQKNAPYGNQSDEAINNLARAAMQWFVNNDIENVLIACNTVSAVSLSILKKEYPSLNIYGIIDLTASQIHNQDKHIAIVSTQATYQSHAYAKALHENEVTELALPELVKHIESLDDEQIIKNYLGNFKQPISTCDKIILGCTHYPLVAHLFKEVFEIETLDSRKPIRQFVGTLAVGENGYHCVYTTGDAEIMSQQISDLFNIQEEVVHYGD
ncbi:MAG: aspartate/glutamate racemase family protein [Erysipelothrix sp.]